VSVRTLITGGAGFIGANLARTLVEHQDVAEVVVLDDLSSGHRANLDGVPVEVVVGSILDRDTLDRVVEGVDAIVHLAARPSVPRSIDDPMATHQANATGTLEVLEAARRHGGPQVIVASSSSVYGANPELPKRESLRPQPMSPYAVSKLATETYALSHGHVFGLPTLAFRFFNVYGPLQAAGHAYAAVIPAFCDAALAGRPLPIHGDGTQSRDFTYVGTVCSVIADAVVRGVSDPDPVNLAFGSRRTLLEVVTARERELGHPVERNHQPVRAGDVPHSQADGTRLHSIFPEVEPVGFDDGLAATVDWFRSSSA